MGRLTLQRQHFFVATVNRDGEPLEVLSDWLRTEAEARRAWIRARRFHPGAQIFVSTTYEHRLTVS